MKVVQMLEESVFRCVKLLIARAIPMVVLRMFDVERSIAGAAKVTMVSFGRRKVWTEGRTCIVCSNVVEAPEKSTAPHTTVRVFVHIFDIRKDLLAVSASEGFVWCSRVEVLQMVFLALAPPHSTVKLTRDEVLSNMLTSFGPVF